MLGVISLQHLPDSAKLLPSQTLTKLMAAGVGEHWQVFVVLSPNGSSGSGRSHLGASFWG